MNRGQPMGPGLDIDSAEKPPLSENSGHQMINQAPIVRIWHLCAKYCFLIFGKRLFQQNRKQGQTP
jgi:hypothetical protein